MPVLRRESRSPGKRSKICPAQDIFCRDSIDRAGEFCYGDGKVVWSNSVISVGEGMGNKKGEL